jgi:hypothetical protein
MATPEERPEQGVSITSLFGMRTQQGLVRVKIGPLDQQWSSAEARRVAYLLLEAAEGADYDQLFVTWAREKLGLTDQRQIAQILAEFRIIRSREPSVLAKTFHEILGDEP